MKTLFLIMTVLGLGAYYADVFGWIPMVDGTEGHALLTAYIFLVGYAVLDKLDSLSE